MTPEQKAMAKERGTKALKEMREFGFPGKKASLVIKRLLKSLDFNWELIEAENYSILVDAIISFDDSDEQQPLQKRMEDGDEEDGGRQNGHVMPTEAPLRRKRATANQEEQLYTGDFIVKKPKLEVDNLHGDHVQHETLQNGSDANFMRSTESVLLGASSRLESPDQAALIANSKGKGIAIEGQDDVATLRAQRGDNTPAVDRAQPLVIFREPKIEPGTEPILKKTGGRLEPCQHDKNIAMNHPPPSGAPTVNISSSCPSIHNQCHLVPSQKDYSAGGNCLEPEPTIRASSIPKMHKNRNSDGIPRNSSCMEVELASSSDGNVKLLLSFEEVSADYQMPFVDSILEVVEDRCFKLEKDSLPEVSLKDTLKEMCQILSEIKKNGSSIPPNALGEEANGVATLNEVSSEATGDFLGPFKMN